MAEQIAVERIGAAIELLRDALCRSAGGEIGEDLLVALSSASNPST
jgi:hypothetical protein